MRHSLGEGDCKTFLYEAMQIEVDTVKMDEDSINPAFDASIPF